MTPVGLFAQAVEKIAKKGEGAELILVVPREAHGSRMRLAGRSGPLCTEVLNCCRGGTMCVFSARKVADWLVKSGLVVKQVGLTIEDILLECEMINPDGLIRFES